MYSNQKWGFENSSQTIIKPQYDTAFSFDRTAQIALVGNKNEFNKQVNPLTGEEESTYNYFYINPKNEKIKLVDENFPDTMFTFPSQQELSFEYLSKSNFFKILFQNKVYLFHKNGKQLSAGFDDVYPSKSSLFYFTENYSEADHKPVRILGLIDSCGKTIAKNKYHEITINMEDSVIYCCSAVFSNKLSDDVYDFKGKLFYTNKKHIAFSSKNIHVLKTYEPKESYIIENDITKKNYTIEGEEFLYLKNNKALIKQTNDLILLDLLTGKEKKVNPEKFYEAINFLLEFN